MTSSPSDPMDPVRLQLMLTGVREALGDLPARRVQEVPGPRFRRTADSPLFDGLLSAGPETPAPAEVVSSLGLTPGGTGAGPLLNPVSLAAVIARHR